MRPADMTARPARVPRCRLLCGLSYLIVLPLLVISVAPAAGAGLSPAVWLSPTIWLAPLALDTQSARIEPLAGGRFFVLHLDSRPPANYRMPVVLAPQGVRGQGIKGLTGVPAFDWSYGCLPTATAMVVGYYDRLTYPNLYTGPSAGTTVVGPLTVDGGVCPLNNSAWGIGECPLAATHQGIDGRAIRGHVDDYYITNQSPDPDPYITYGWPEHAWGDCTADFMGSSQSEHNNLDGDTQIILDGMGFKVENYTAQEPDLIDGAMGWKRFIQSRGYTVTHAYNQLIEGVGKVTGFTWDQYKAEIDAGRPVILEAGPHALVGYGYNDTGKICYIHDTWDYFDHQIAWGGVYATGTHVSVTVLELAPSSAPTLTWTGAAGYEGDGVNPDQAAPGSNFVFKVRYMNTGAVPPSLVRLYLYGPDGLAVAGSPFTMTSDGTTNWQAGVTYSCTVKLPNRGAYAYVFTAKVGADTIRIPASTRQPGPVADRPPTLAWTGAPGYTIDGLQPERGLQGTSFVFKVKYADPDGDPPAYVRLRLWLPDGTEMVGSPFTMTRDAGTPNYMAGVGYSKTLALTLQGRYKYRFLASDGVLGVNQPDGGQMIGPLVDHPPVLQWTGETGYTQEGVQPDTGPPGTVFTFKVKYSDADGDAPTDMKLRVYRPDGTELTGSPFLMTPAAGTPDWVAGVVFSRQLKLGGHGQYSYLIATSSGGIYVRLPADARQPGPVVDKKPVLSWVGTAGYTTDGVNPDWQGPNQPLTFQIKYSDGDGDPATLVRLYLFSPKGVAVAGSPFAMTQAEGTPDWKAGVIFRKTLTLPGHGWYAYLFTANAGDVSTRIPATTRKAGPLLDRAPALSWTGQAGYTEDGVEPNSGAGGTTFTFRVKYADPDSDPAKNVKLHLFNPGGAEAAGSPFAMTQAAGTPDWKTGVIFSKQLPLNTAGTYSYQFEASDGFLILTTPSVPTTGPVVTSAGPTSLTVGSVTAQQVGAGVAVTYSLSAPGTVRAVVLNLAGRTIAEIPAGVQEAGVQTLHWNGRNAAGSLVPAGVYLVRVEARSEEGATAQAATAVALRR